MRSLARFLVVCGLLGSLVPLPVFAQVATTSTTTPSNAPRPICSLSASHSTYNVGDTVNIRWTSSNATGGTITGLGSVGPEGLQGILPTGQSTTITGVFVGPGGTSEPCSVTMTYANPLDTGIGSAFGTPSGGSGSGSSGSGGTGASGNNGSVSGSNVGGSQGPIVPCSGLNCRPCDLANLAQRIINFLIGLSIPIAAAMFAYAGFLYFTSAANPKGIGKAKNVFKTVFWGFVIAIGAWLIIQTLLKVVLTPTYYQSWNVIQCSTQGARYGVPGNYSSLPNLLNGILGGINANAPIAVSGNSVAGGGGVGLNNSAYSCDTGYKISYSDGLVSCDKTDSSGNLVDSKDPTCTYGGTANDNGQCTNQNGDLVLPSASPNQNFSGGGCDGLSAQQQCVARYESSCNPLLPSGVDRGADGNSVSWGLFQVNLSANSLQCNGQTLNCPAAFGGGAYTSRNHNTYVKDAALYNQCTSLAQDPQCSQQMFDLLKSQRGGSIRDWGNAAYNNCSGL